MKPGTPHLTGDCRPVGEILARIGDKWSVFVVTRLGKKSCASASCAASSTAFLRKCSPRPCAAWSATAS